MNAPRAAAPRADDLPAFARSRWWPWIGSAPFVLYGLFLLSRGEVRWEVLLLMAGVPALAFATPGTRRLYTGLLPLGFVAILYDGLRFARIAGTDPSRVLLCDLRAAELSLFGFVVDGQRVTAHDWLQRHSHPALDLLCAIPYGTHIFLMVVVGVVLYRRDFLRLQRFAWTFLLLNVAGFITYKLLPAAPPWYFHAHGCAVDLATRGNEGPNLARVDLALGVKYFHGLYGRASNVFGALPSLHVAYPTMAFLEARPVLRTPGRVALGAYTALMYFAAVYLDHHWVLDVLLGGTYAVALLGVVHLAFRRPAR
ncbi:MAG: phosphatase PAP2 family protein [Polyangiales bacterium]